MTVCRAQEERAAHTVGPRGRRSRGRGGRGGGGGDSGRWEDVPRREWGTERSIGRDEFGRDILSDRPVSPPPVRARFDRPERGKHANTQVSTPSCPGIQSAALRDQEASPLSPNSIPYVVYYQNLVS